MGDVDTDCMDIFGSALMRGCGSDGEGLGRVTGNPKGDQRAAGSGNGREVWGLVNACPVWLLKY